MPDTLVTEMFDSGLVTARDASLLQAGELQQSDDCIYRRNDPSIQSVGGRTEYNSTQVGSGTLAIKGGAHLTFDSGKTDQLVVHAGNALYKSDFSTVTGTFSKLTGPGQVTDAVANGTSTITSATNGFVDMVVGALIFGTQVPVGARVLTVAVGGGSITMTANALGSGTFTLTALIGIAISGPNVGTETLDYVQWGSIYYTMITGTRPVRLHWTQRAAVSSAELAPVFTGRSSGLDPVTSFGRGTTAGDASGPDVVAGAWNTDLGTGTYWFMVVEAVAVGEPDEVEGSYLVGISANDPKSTLQVPSASITNVATQAIRITFPTVINNGANGKNYATHWIVYMSDKTLNTSTFPSLATFKRAAVVPISSTSTTIGVASTQYGPFFAGSQAAGPNGQPQWGNPSGFLNTGDMAFATSGFPTAATNNAEQSIGTFGLGSVSGTVRGIRIRVHCEAWTRYLPVGDDFICTGRGDFYVQIISGTKRSPVFFGTVVGQYLQVVQFGNSTDAMGVTWSAPGDFANGVFTVLIGKSPTTEKQFMKVRRVDVTVFTGNEIISGGRPFPTVTYRSQIGTTVVDPAALPPPNATTGDVFMGQLVLNDPADESMIRYSLPGFPEYFPRPYFMRLDSKKRDRVKFIRRVGQILVVGLQSSMKRINYLPTELDVNPRAEVAHEDLASDHGTVGPMAGCLFDPDEGGVMLAYVSTKGLHATDGIATRFLNTDLDWENTIAPAAISTCVLRNYSKQNWLVLFYSPAGTSHGKNTRAMIFSYDPKRIKADGTLPAIGPFKVSGRCAIEAHLSGISYLLTGHEALAKVYVEDNGLTLPASYTVANSAGTEEAITLVPTIKTRRFFPGGLNRQGRVERVYVHSSIVGATSTVANAVVTAESATVTSLGLFGSVLPGMYVSGDGLKPGTIVLTASANSLTLSQTAHTSGAAVTLTFSTGTLCVTSGGQDIGVAAATSESVYIPLHVGGLVVVHPSAMKQALELTFTRVLKPDLTTVSLSPQMKLNYFAYLLADAGQESNRATF